MKKHKVHWPSYARKLRKSAEKYIAEGKYPKNEIERALSIPEPYYRTYALAEITLRLHKKQMEYGDIWEKALESVREIEPGWKREEMLEKLASIGHRCSADIASFPLLLEEREMMMKLLSKISRLIMGDDEKIMEIWESFREKDEAERYEALRILIHNGLSASLAEKFMGELSDERKKLLREYMHRERSSIKGKKQEKRGEKLHVEPLKGPEPQFTIALYNTYKGKPDSSHYRNIARAASLCYAFELKLALIDFPFKNAEECVEKTFNNTRIGKGGEYLRELERAGWLSLHADIESIEGKIVATSSHPDPEKAIDPENVPTESTFILGLGHQGLPASVLNRADFHLEFTGKGASLETCTAMGVLAHMLGEKKRRG